MEPTSPSVLTSNKGTLLKFNVVFSDGGHHSHSYRVENVLSPDSSVYCTKKKINTNILLKCDGDDPFTLTHIIVKAPSTGFDSPIGEGLIFVSFEPIDVSITKKFEEFDANTYKEYVSKHYDINHRSTLKPSDPAAFFQLKDTYGIVQRLPTPRSGYYILVKLLRSRNDGNNVDIQYIGFKGFTGPCVSQEGSLR